MSTLADSMLSWKANLTTMAKPEQALTLRADIDAFYKAGYRDGSTNYELEHCPACKNVAELQAALDENAKLQEDLEDQEGYDQMLRDRLRQQTELCVKAEVDNAKLRELVRLLLWGVDNDMPRYEELAWTQKVNVLVRELGIEVD